MKPSKKLEIVFEHLFWNFRLVIIIPVFFGLLSAIKFFMIGTVEIWVGFNLRFDATDPEGDIASKIVSYLIGGVDYYLIGIVLLIFSFGIYELFISEIDVKFKHNINILQSESLGDLKSKLVRVIVVALIVSLFKKMLSLQVSLAIDLVYISLSIFLIAVSSYLLQMHDKLPNGIEKKS